MSLTFAQLIYLAGGIGFFVAVWIFTRSVPLAIFFGGPVALLGVGLAFYKVNDRPLIDVLEHMASFYLTNNTYKWRKVNKRTGNEAKLAQERELDPIQFVPSATANKIKDLAWSLDIKESMYSDKSQK